MRHAVNPGPTSLLTGANDGIAGDFAHFNGSPWSSLQFACFDIVNIARPGYGPSMNQLHLWHCFHNMREGLCRNFYRWDQRGTSINRWTSLSMDAKGIHPLRVQLLRHCSTIQKPLGQFSRGSNSKPVRQVPGADGLLSQPRNASGWSFQSRLEIRGETHVQLAIFPAFSCFINHPSLGTPE